MKSSRLAELMVGIDHKHPLEGDSTAAEFYGYMARQLLAICDITEKPNLTQFMEESA